MVCGKKKFILGLLKQVADSFVSVMGRHCEVAVRDLTMLENSLIYLAGKVTKKAWISDYRRGPEKAAPGRQSSGRFTQLPDQYRG